MKVEGSSGAAPAKPVSRAQGAAAADFSVAAAPARAAAPAGPSGAVSAVTSLDALLALQEAPGPGERRRRALKRANALLDSLDAIKLAVLDGELNPAALEALRTAILEERGNTDDPRLDDILSQIEIRAAVELAKQEAVSKVGRLTA